MTGIGLLQNSFQAGSVNNSTLVTMSAVPVHHGECVSESCLFWQLPVRTGHASRPDRMRTIASICSRGTALIDKNPDRTTVRRIVLQLEIFWPATCPGVPCDRAPCAIGYDISPYPRACFAAVTGPIHSNS